MPPSIPQNTTYIGHSPGIADHRIRCMSICVSHCFM